MTEGKNISDFLKILRLEIARRLLRHFYFWAINSISNLPLYREVQEFEQ
jgi:hypothetical protein